jgi:hypothetical protein
MATADERRLVVGGELWGADAEEGTESLVSR